MEEVSRRSREAQEEDMMLRDDHRVYDDEDEELELH
jgi:hypothetical protein